MAHINISRRDRYSVEERYAERISILEAEKAHLSSLLDSAQKNLDAIFDNIESGHECYLQYKCGKRIFIRAVLHTETSS